MVGSPDYLVQSPEGSMDDKVEPEHAEPDMRFSSRDQLKVHVNVMDKVESAAKKRNLEGNSIPLL